MRSRPRDRDRKGCPMPLITLIGKVGQPLGRPLIRKPGDLPVHVTSRVDGVFHDRLVFARGNLLLAPSGHFPRC